MLRFGADKKKEKRKKVVPYVFMILKVMWTINKWAQGTQTLVMRMNVDEVMFQPMLELYTILGI